MRGGLTTACGEGAVNLFHYICQVRAAIVRVQQLIWTHVHTQRRRGVYFFISSHTLHGCKLRKVLSQQEMSRSPFCVLTMCVCVCVCATIRYGSSPEFSVSGPRSCTAGEDAPFTRESTSGWNEEQGKCQNRLILFQLGIWERCMNADGMYTKRKTQHMTTYAAKYNLFSARFIDISVFL